MNKESLKIWTTIASLFAGVNVAIDSFIYLVEYGKWLGTGEMLVFVFSLLCGIAVAVVASVFMSKKYQNKSMAVSLASIVGGLAVVLFIGVCVGLFLMVFKMLFVTLTLAVLMIWYLNVKEETLKGKDQIKQ